MSKPNNVNRFYFTLHVASMVSSVASYCSLQYVVYNIFSKFIANTIADISVPAINTISKGNILGVDGSYQTI